MKAFSRQHARSNSMSGYKLLPCSLIPTCLSLTAILFPAAFSSPRSTLSPCNLHRMAGCTTPHWQSCHYHTLRACLPVDQLVLTNIHLYCGRHSKLPVAQLDKRWPMAKITWWAPLHIYFSFEGLIFGSFCAFASISFFVFSYLLNTITRHFRHFSYYCRYTER
jgi:hypothetical protein